ncbi:MAG TPA: hypothetical protein VFI95_02055 [Terriglobales bacterium]|nr:hypothetical protein [Terriglobales bacterium]
MRSRIAVSLAIGVASGLYCWILLRHFHLGAADFHSALDAAQDLLHGRNPYQRPLQLYPITAALFALPLHRLSSDVAAGLFFGCSSAILAFGLTRQGYAQLLVFLVYPYWAALLTAQWAPLIMASALFPILLPATTAKPQLGLPVILTHPTRRGLAACVLWMALSFAWMPRWPVEWWRQLGSYQHFVPLLVWPGPLLLLALFRYRRRSAWLMLLLSVTPQRWFYDSFVLWLIPKSRRSIVFTAAISWGAGILRWYHMPSNFAQTARWADWFIYLPMLVAVLFGADEPATRGEAPA